MSSEELRPIRSCSTNNKEGGEYETYYKGKCYQKGTSDNSIDLLCNEEQLYECLDNVRIGLIAKYLFMRLNNGNAYKGKT